MSDPGSFGRVDIQPPYKAVARFRQVGEKEPHTVEREHPSSIAGVLNALRSG